MIPEVPQPSPTAATSYRVPPPIEDASETTPTGRVHDGRAVYFDSIDGRNAESAKAYPQTSGMSSSDMAALQTSQALELPPRAVKSCYIDNFFKYCHPWAPVVDPSWLRETTRQKPSLLLLQAVLLAGSRVTTPINLAASSGFYARAKALFFSNYEQNPVILIITCLLLQWWNPAGPERICMDKSNFWMRTGVGIAIEIGLHKESSNARDAAYRRRLWWSLVARDSQISASQGRPSAIQTEESTVSFLSVRDFSSMAHDRPALSVNFVAICRIFGDIGESCRRKQMTASKMSQLKDDLHAWVRGLPPELRLFHPRAEFGLNAYSFEARQLHIIYFVVLILLLRHMSPSTSPISAGSLLAASFVAATYDEFMVRDEMSHLGPAIHKFFLLTAGITLLSACRSPPLQEDASQDFSTVKAALRLFADRYPSSLATIHTLETLEAAQERSPERFEHLPLQPEVYTLFQEFGPGFCRQWHLLVGLDNVGSSREEQPAETQRRGADSSSMASTTRSIVPYPHGAGSNNQYTLDGDSFGPETVDGSGVQDSFWPLWTELPDPTSWILKDTPFDLGDDPGFS